MTELEKELLKTLKEFEAQLNTERGSFAKERKMWLIECGKLSEEYRQAKRDKAALEQQLKGLAEQVGSLQTQLIGLSQRLGVA